jgi:putative DNA primase/helicase
MSNNLKPNSDASEGPQLIREAGAELDELGRKGEASGNGTCRDQAASAKISVLLNGTGVSVLTANSTPDDREVVLRELATAAVTLDPLGRAVLRDAAIRILGSIGVSSPARLVDAALALAVVADKPTDDILDAPKPWEDTVDGAELLSALATAVGRYVVLPDGSGVALALWIVHTYALDAAAISPIIAIVSPTRRCGKSTLLDVLAALVLRPMAASNVSAAAVYRAVERWRPTLLLDELDTYIHDTDELRGVINSSHRRSQAYVARCEERAGEIVPVRYSTWCARALACIGRLPETLEDRSIILRLRRRAANETVARYRHDRTPGELEPLRRQAARWARDSEAVLYAADPAMPPELHDREADSWRPLFAIAEIAGGSWPSLARDAALALSDARATSDATIGIELLRDLRTIFAARAVPRIPTDDLIRDLTADAERPWATYQGGRSITARKLARLLDPFEIGPTKWRDGIVTARGYQAADMGDAWSRYLPAETHCVDPPQMPHVGGAAAYMDSAPPQTPACGTSLSVRKSFEISGVADVADGNRGCQGEYGQEEGAV